LPGSGHKATKIFVNGAYFNLTYYEFINFDGFVKSPPASHPEGISSLRSGHSQKVFVTAAYFYVRLIPQLFGA